MLQRLYVDNFGCLVNFELRFDRLVLLLGENGAGKTTVFDVLYRLRRFLMGERGARHSFPASSLTRWQTKTSQEFNLELQIGEDLYRYELSADHVGPARRAQVQYENLQVNGSLVFTVQAGKARLISEDRTLGPEFPFDPDQSVVGSFLPSSDGGHLSRFKAEIEKIIVCSLEPMNMTAKSTGETKAPLRNMKNFVNWFRFLSQEYQGAILHLNQELREVLPGFHSFSIREIREEAREMRAHFQDEMTDTPRLSYSLDELSDGQRVLIVLYTLLYGLEDRGAYLFLDEPENFVALREIQPWLTALTDAVGGPIKQAALISHHPEMIDYLGVKAGRWFERRANGPARLSEQTPPGLGSLDRPSAAVARGWEK